MFRKNFMTKMVAFLFILMTASVASLDAQALGDVNHDSSINIVDALLIAQYYVGLNPANFYTAQADVNCSSSIDIVDALIVAQYYVGLVPAPSCGGTAAPTSPPTGAPTAPPTAGPSSPPTAVPTGGSQSCAGNAQWNSQVVYNTTGQLVQYNCNLYQNQGFAFNLDPETNNGQYYPWLLLGPCTESNCPMGEGPFIGCGQWDKYVIGDWTVYNNVWGNSTPNAQCLTAYSIANWSVVSTQPATSGVKSYPNTGPTNVNRAINTISSMTSSFNVTVPGGGDYEVAYDIWVPSEIMLWMHKVGNVGPLAGGWDDQGNPIPDATNVTVGGHTWNVYHCNNPNVVSFLRTTNTTSGTVDIKAILNWIVNAGWIQANGILGAPQFGFEISGTGNQPLTFTCNSYSLTIN